MRMLIVLATMVILSGYEVVAMSPINLRADPCGEFVNRVWTVREHQLASGHSPNDLDLLSPEGMQFTLTPAPSIKVVSGVNGRSVDQLQNFWSSFNQDLECNVSYKTGVTFNRLEARGTVSIAGEHAHAHYFTMVSQTCDSGKVLFTSWITDERPVIEPKGGAGTSSMCLGEGVHPNFDGVAVPKTHNGRWHGTSP